ncbi:MAG TPA: rod shape-determining protein RodA [Candidatus Scatomorpha merdigallinarum]|nr:rod shape-determining protein RodA [Candidatus Scatomorpha merdigallinarum]
MPQLKEFFRRADMLLLIVSLISALYGLTVIWSATLWTDNGPAQYVIVQTLGIVIGVAAFAVITVIDLDIFSAHWKWLYALSAGLFVLLIFFGQGDATTGNNGWLRFAGIGIQPTEFIKLAFIVVLGKHLVYLKTRRDLNSFISIAQLAGHFIIMFGIIIVTAGDLGSALVYFFIFAVMMFMAGVRIYWFIIGFAAIAAMVPIAWTYFLEDYQKNRILAPYDPSIDPTNTGVNWQQHQAEIALGSGQLTGAGLGQGTQTQSGSIPSQHTDFIFAVIGEELGMIGACAVLLLLTIIVVRCIQVGLRSGDTLSALVCFGVAASVVFQTFENVGMCIGIAPVVGITLPFFSYGGSSVVSMFMAMGLVSGVRYRPKPVKYRLY